MNEEENKVEETQSEAVTVEETVVEKNDGKRYS